MKRDIFLVEKKIEIMNLHIQIGRSKSSQDILKKGNIHILRGIRETTTIGTWIGMIIIHFPLATIAEAHIVIEINLRRKILKEKIMKNLDLAISIQTRIGKCHQFMRAQI